MSHAETRTASILATALRYAALHRRTSVSVVDASGSSVLVQPDHAQLTITAIELTSAHSQHVEDVMRGVSEAPTGSNLVVLVVPRAHDVGGSVKLSDAELARSLAKLDIGMDLEGMLGDTGQPPNAVLFHIGRLVSDSVNLVLFEDDTAISHLLLQYGMCWSLDDVIMEPGADEGNGTSQGQYRTLPHHGKSGVYHQLVEKHDAAVMRMLDELRSDKGRLADMTAELHTVSQRRCEEKPYSSQCQLLRLGPKDLSAVLAVQQSRNGLIISEYTI